ncbi:MAG: formate dehydrogenase accessory protein FdhE [Desulfuromonadaceae bacterium]
MIPSEMSYLNRLVDTISGLPALSLRFPEAAALLNFLAPVFETQKELSVLSPQISSIHEAASLPWAASVRGMASTVSIHGTAEISSVARTLLHADDDAISALVTKFIKQQETGAAERLIVMASLGGLAAGLPALNPFDRREWLQPTCPVCGMPPIASFLSDVEEIDGCRLLYCGVCHASWHFNRTTCHHCATNDDHQLDYFHPEGDTSVVVQACRSCKAYLKIIDMRLFATIVPEVIDIATISLDLHAQEKGFNKVFANMFGY